MINEVNNEKKNQILLVSIIVLLLGFVLAYVVFDNVKAKDVSENKLNVQIKQVYSSDYDLHLLNNEYYFGTYDGKLNVFINLEGVEVFKTSDLISFENYYKMSDGNYLFYNNEDNKLNIYVFDGESLRLYYTFDNVSYVKPIICNDVIVGFSSFMDEKLYLYNLTSEGINVLSDVTLVADKFIDNTYYINNANSLVLKNKDENYGVVNVTGDLILDFKYKDVITLTENNKFIVKNDVNKYGIVDNENNVLLDFKYDGIVEYKDYYVIIKGNKMALFDKEFNVLIDFKMNYNTLLDFNYRSGLSVELYTKDDYVIIVNNLDEDKYKREYEYHDLYVIYDNNIVKTIEQIAYNNELMYSYDDGYKINLYNSNFESNVELDFTNVTKINNIVFYNQNTIEITYLDMENKEYIEYYDINGKLVENYDKVVLNNSLYYGVIKDNSLVLYDHKNKELTKISGDKIEINKDCITVDKALYKLVVE